MTGNDAVLAETIAFAGHGGDLVEGYLARPLGARAAGGVVVLHHMPGYDEATKEITRRFAAAGYHALCPNLYTRHGRELSPDDAAAKARAAGGVPDDQLVGDAAGAVAHLRALTSANGRVATIGYCSGGRQSVLAACRLDLQAAVDCYGAFVVREPPADLPVSMTPLVGELDSLSCPLLGLFGAEDANPSPDEVAELDRLLTAAGKEHEFHSYDDAGHAFFAVDRPAYRVAAATDGWARILDFFARHLAS